MPYHYFRTNVSFALHCPVLEQILAWRVSTPTRCISPCNSRSLSVPSNPSLNDCAVSSTEFPPPDGPKAAKCCAWSMTSVKRPRKVWSASSDPRLSRSRRGYTHTSVKIFDIPSPCSSFNLLGCFQYYHCGERSESTCISIIIFPKPYQSPPAPTRAESLTLRGSALSAFLTLEPKGAGMLKSAQSLDRCQSEGI